MTEIVWAINLFLFNGLPALRFLQIKDYHWQRVKAHFYLPSSKKLIFNLKELLLYFAFFASLVLFPRWRLTLRAGLIFFLLLLIWRRKLNAFLVWTKKATVLALAQIAFLSLLLFFSQTSLPSIFFLGTFAWQLFLLSILADIFYHLSKLITFRTRKKIKAKILQAKKTGTKLIMIVGSYGKSSVKHYLSEILIKISNVCTPPERVNQEFALIKFFQHREITEKFIVVEYGAYDVGQISFTASFLPPDIGIITGITEQHYAVFGSMEKILRGEGYEVLENMSEGTLVVNLNHPYQEKLLAKIKSLLQERKVTLITYGTHNADYHFEILNWNLHGAKIKLKAKEEVVELDLPIFIPFQIENLVGAIAILHQFFPLPKIIQTLSEITILDKSMSVRQKNGLLIFDASYNANPRGVLEALQFLQQVPTDYKFVIFHNLIELGSLAKEIFAQIGEKAKFVDLFFSTFPDYDKILREKLKEKFVLIGKKEELEIFLKTIPKNSAILILGRPSEKFANLLI